MSDEGTKPPPARSPLALPKNLVASIAYCDSCSPRLFMGFGGFHKAPAHVDVKTGVLHTATLKEVGVNEPMEAGESLEVFGDRMMKKYGVV